MADNKKSLTYVVEVVDKGKITVNGVKSSFRDLEKQIKSTSVSTDNFSKKNVDLIATSGLAGATLTEFGRTVSDYNYGIRGMANNLSQLSTLFITLVGKAGTFGKAMTILKAQLLGPMGLILLFQVAITVLEAFSLKQDKAKKSTDGLTEALGRQAQRFVDFQQGIGRYNTDLEKTNDIITVMSNRFPEFKKLVEGLGDKPSRENLEGLMLMYTDFLKTQDKLTKKEKELSKLREEFFKIPEAERTRNMVDKFEADKIRLVGEIFDLELRIAQFKDIFEDEGGKSNPAKFVREQLEALNPMFDKFFFDINKKGEIVFKNALKDVEFTLRALTESSLEATDELDRMGERYNDYIRRREESLKNGLAFIKEQAKEINDIFNASQKAFASVSDVIMSYHDVRMEALARERDYILNSGRLSEQQQRKAIDDIERREIKAQEKKIKLERDLFTIKQSLLIAEEIMNAKADLRANARKMGMLLSQIGSEAAVQAGKAQMSIGAFAAEGGLKGMAAYAISIAGMLASIASARRKAKAQLMALGAPSTGGGGGGVGVEAPDFNVVGASPESQLAQSVIKQQTQPLRAFVVHKDIKNANDLDRTITGTSALG